MNPKVKFVEHRNYRYIYLIDGVEVDLKENLNENDIIERLYYINSSLKNKVDFRQSNIDMPLRDFMLFGYLFFKKEISNYFVYYIEKLILHCDKKMLTEVLMLKYIFNVNSGEVQYTIHDSTDKSNQKYNDKIKAFVSRQILEGKKQLVKRLLLSKDITTISKIIKLINLNSFLQICGSEFLEEAIEYFDFVIKEILLPTNIQLSLNGIIASATGLSRKEANVEKISKFLEYFNAYESLLPLMKVNQATVERYRKYIDTKDIAKSTKVKCLQAVADFFCKLDGWEGIPINNPVNKRVHLYKRKKSDNELKTRYIPDSITKELDKIFFTEEVPIHFRLYYWFCRMYPSRCSEISSLKIDCIKPLGDKYVLFKAEEKSSNDIGESNLINIHIKYEDMGKFLVDLYHEQKRISQVLEDKANERFKGLLFLYNPITTKYTEPKQQKRVCLVVGKIFNDFLKKLCKEKDFIKGLDEGIKITSHAFRHNGITDRLYAGFSPTSIRDLTGQKSDGEVIGTYHYRKKDEIEKLQKKALKERFSKNKVGPYEKLNNQQTSKNFNEDVTLMSPKVMFRGRIMNLDGSREQRILANKRAYQISYSDKSIGICTEIASCNNGIFNCFKCNEFAPDSDEFGFFKEQVNYWEEKVDYFQLRGNQYQMEHAIEVKGLFETIVLRIEDINKRNNLGER